MKTIKFKGRARKAWKTAVHLLKTKSGAALPKTGLKFNGTYEAFETFAELVAAKEELTNDEQVKARNNQLKAKAKAAAQKAALDAAGVIEPSMENDEQLQLLAVYNGIMAGKKKTHEEARAIAENAVGVKWADSGAAVEADDDDDDEDEE